MKTSEEISKSKRLSMSPKFSAIRIKMTFQRISNLNLSILTTKITQFFFP